MGANRQPKNELKLYYRRDIDTNGRDKFKEYFGY